MSDHVVPGRVRGAAAPLAEANALWHETDDLRFVGLMALEADVPGLGPWLAALRAQEAEEWHLYGSWLERALHTCPPDAAWRYRLLVELANESIERHAFERAGGLLAEAEPLAACAPLDDRLRGMVVRMSLAPYLNAWEAWYGLVAELERLEEGTAAAQLARAWAMLNQANHTLAFGRSEAAVILLQRGLGASRSAGPRAHAMTIMARIVLALAYARIGALAKAREELAWAEDALSRVAFPAYADAAMMMHRARVHERLGDRAEADRLFEQGANRMIGGGRLDSPLTAWMFVVYGSVCRRRGHFERARACYERAHELAGKCEVYRGGVLMWWALTELAAGDLDRARRCLAEAPEVSHWTVVLTHLRDLVQGLVGDPAARETQAALVRVAADPALLADQLVQMPDLGPDLIERLERAGQDVEHFRAILNNDMASREICFIGGFTVLVGGLPVARWPRRSARLLAALLAANPDGLDRDEAAARIFPHMDAIAARHQLANALSVLRDVVEPRRTSRGNGVVVVGAGDYLVLRGVKTDWSTYAALAQDGGAAPEMDPDIRELLGPELRAFRQDAPASGPAGA